MLAVTGFNEPPIAHEHDLAAEPFGLFNIVGDPFQRRDALEQDV